MNLHVDPERRAVELGAMADDPPLLVVDDDTELCELLVEYLGAEGFRVECAHTGPDGLALATTNVYSLVILDVMLPGASGFEILRRLRARSQIPVLMLTARGEDVDRVVGLEMGADDYLAKPFNPRELVARIRAIHRRTNASASAGREPIAVGDVTLDVGRREVLRAGLALTLTSAEFALLEVLMRAAGHVVTREDIAEKVLGRNFSPFDRSIDVHVSNLRRKLDVDGRERIKTVRGTGYQFVVG